MIMKTKSGKTLLVRICSCFVLAAVCSDAITAEDEQTQARPTIKQYEACKNLVQAQKNQLSAQDGSVEAGQDLIAALKAKMEAQERLVSVLQAQTKNTDKLVENHQKLVTNYERKDKLNAKHIGDQKVMIGQQKEIIRLMNLKLAKQDELLDRYQR